MKLKEEKNGTLFHTDSKDRVQSPEKLNEYIRVSSPGGIVLIAALILVSASVIIWGVIGKIPITMTQKGVIGVLSQESFSSCFCFINADLVGGSLPEDTKASIHLPDGTVFQAKLEFMLDPTLSEEEIRSMFDGTDFDFRVYSDWTLDQLLGNGTYFYFTSFESAEEIPLEYYHKVADVTIVMEEVRPISFLMR